MRFYSLSQLQPSIDFLYSIASIIVPVSMQLIFLWCAANLIESSTYGKYTLLLALNMGIAALITQPSMQAFDRFYNQQENIENFVSQFRFINIFANIFFIFIVIVYSSTFDQHKLPIVTLLILLNFISLKFGLDKQVFLLNLDRRRYLLIRILEGLSRSIFPLVGYLVFNNILGLLVGLVCGFLITSFISSSMLNLNSKWKIIYDAKSLKKYAIFAYPTIFVSISSWGISFSDRYFIDYFFTKEAVGIYAVLTGFAGMIAMAGQLWTIYVGPIILKMFETDPIRAIKKLKFYWILLCIIFFFAVIFIFSIPKFVYGLILPDAYIMNSLYMSTFYILCLATIFAVIQLALTLWFQLYSKLKMIGIFYILGLVINLIGNFYIKDFGIIAGAYSTLAAYIAIVSCQSIYILINKHGVLRGEDI